MGGGGGGDKVANSGFVGRLALLTTDNQQLTTKQLGINLRSEFQYRG
jgi:hypothetical protein